MSDGSDYLYFWDADTFEEKRFVRVTLPINQDGAAGVAPLWYINELEVVGGALLANVWYADKIVRIDLDTGLVNAVYDFTGLHRRFLVRHDSFLFLKAPTCPCF